MELLYAAFGYLVLCISTCGTQAASYQGRYLTYSSTAVSWNTAYATCSTSGGHLLTVDNNVTINALSYIRAQPVAAAISIDIWMGLHNTETTSDVPVYVWADCKHLDDNTAIWYPGEPNIVTLHRCIITSPEYEWKTRDCTEAHAFFCENAFKSDCTFETADEQTCEMGGVLLESEMENDACATRCQEDMDGSDICWAYEYNTQSKQCKLLFGSDPYMCETLQANKGYVTGRRRCFKFSDITGSEVKGEYFPTCNTTEVTASQTTSITTTSDNTPYITTTTVAATRYTSTKASATQDTTTTTSPSLETTTTSAPTTSDTTSTPETTRDTTMTSTTFETTTTTTTSAPTTSDTASTPETTRDTTMTSPSLETTTTTTTTTSAPTTSDTTSTPETSRDTTMTSTTFEASATSAASTPDITATAETLETTFSAPDKTTTTSSPLDGKATSQATDTIIASTASSPTTETIPSTATTATRDTDTPTSTQDTSTAASSGNSTGGVYTPSLTTYLSRLEATLASSTSASSPAVASLGRHVYEVCVSVQTFTAAERKKRTDDMVDDLSLDKKNLSSYRRKKSSAEDERPSAQHVGGGVAIMLLVTAALIIILPDCTSILMHAVHGIKKKQLVAAQQ
ncbi:serine-rich adhesin for platelets-like [Haliotis rufescens]|uniref:serine-rich adhesin for platelets-like n=1 Tax=Haliotis rufescens TaxID=6454 RepID=UPI00201E7B02|nr:serine-rich adhesin for platelets-like [Haliotis rufescens]